ncbi:hypothetical protein CAEBREN_28622 [Caenorhabditis brenneri]|uniref:RNA-directed DNA polymerase n=1 Tax=Caenorhabditis brenneri TaxID=135651 RepID=G0NS51_CAEBE|nr:hypothetical protein CAEBREN_28622 [Caenorhabditis brenneri]
MLMELLNEFPDTFSKNSYDLGSSKTEPVHIYTNTEVPVKARPYRVPIKYQAELEKHINSLLKSGRITESNTPWTSPIVLVKKKNGSLRVCLDFRKLNEATIPDNFPLPRIDAILEKVGGSNYFSSLDMANGYLQLRLDPASSYKCGFITESKVYAYTHLPFGLKSAASYFQRALRTVLGGLEDEVLVYIDDILIYSKTFDQHLETLRKVLHRFRDFNLKASPKKCEFAKKSIVFLGHEISKNTYSPDKANVAKITEFPTPTNINEIRRFVGMAGFFRKFIPNFSEISEPLTRLTRKERKFEWNLDQQGAFEKLRTSLSSEPVLGFPDYDRPFHIFCDASAVAQGAALMQTRLDNEKDFFAIAYASRTLADTETRWPAIQVEMGAIIFALRQFRPYVCMSKIILHSDHKPLTFLLQKSKTHDNLARWLVELQCYDISIIHIDGKKNTVADCLSRARENDDISEAVELKDIIEFPVCMKIDARANAATVIRKNKPSVTLDMVVEQEKDSDILTIKRILQNKILPETAPAALSSRVALSTLAANGTVLTKPFPTSKRDVLFVPKQLTSLIFEAFHESYLSGGHFNWRKTKAKIERRYFWPNMAKEVLERTKACPKCQAKNSPVPAYKERMVPVTTSRVFQKVGLDLTGPLRTTAQGNKYILNIVCWFSKFIVSVPIPDARAETSARALLTEAVLKYGAMTEIVTDNAKTFTCHAFDGFCNLLSIRNHKSIPYWSQGNGATERSFRTFHQLTSKYVNKTHTDWDTILPALTFCYNTTVHSTTGETPFFLMHGRDPIFVIDQILNPAPNDLPSMESTEIDDFRQEMVTNLREAWTAAKEHADKSREQFSKSHDSLAKPSDIRVGDRVMMKNVFSKKDLSRKLVLPWVGQYRVIEVNRPEAVIQDINKPSKPARRVHLDQVKKFIEISGPAGTVPEQVSSDGEDQNNHPEEPTSPQPTRPDSPVKDEADKAQPSGSPHVQIGKQPEVEIPVNEPTPTESTPVARYNFRKDRKPPPRLKMSNWLQPSHSRGIPVTRWPRGPLVQIAVTVVRNPGSQAIAIVVDSSPYEHLLHVVSPLQTFVVLENRLVRQPDNEPANPLEGPGRREIFVGSTQVWTRNTPPPRQLRCSCDPRYTSPESRHNVPAVCQPHSLPISNVFFLFAQTVALKDQTTSHSKSNFVSDHPTSMDAITPSATGDPPPTQIEAPAPTSAPNTATFTENQTSTGDVHFNFLPVSSQEVTPPSSNPDTPTHQTASRTVSSTESSVSTKDVHLNFPPVSVTRTSARGSVELPTTNIDPQEAILLEFGFVDEDSDMDLDDDEKENVPISEEASINTTALINTDEDEIEVILTGETESSATKQPPTDPDAIEIILTNGTASSTIPATPVPTVTAPWKIEETHPFDKYYGRPMLNPQGSAAKQMSQSQSIEAIQKFRNATTEWLGTPLAPLRKPVKISRSPLKAITNLPQEIGAIYIVKDRTGTILYLVPHQAEVVGPDRPDLHVVSISIFPGQFLPGLLRGQSRAIVAESVVPHANRDTVLPTITEVLEWDTEERQVYRKFEKLFTNAPNDCSKLWEVFTRFVFLGYSSVLAAVNKDKDLRTYRTKILQSTTLRNRRVIHFNLYCPTIPPSEAQWTRGTAFKVETPDEVLDFEVENASLRQPFLVVAAKATSCRDDVTDTVAAMKDEEVLVFQTFQTAKQAFTLFPKPDEFGGIPETANFKLFLKALYGGSPIQLLEHNRPRQTFVGPIQPSDEQWAYIHAVVYSKTPALSANSPFGVGKTWTICITLFTAAQESRTTQDIHVGSCVTNAAAVALAQTFDRINWPSRHGAVRVAAVRYISDSNHDSQEPQKHSNIDFPTLWPGVFEDFIHNQDRYRIDDTERQTVLYAARFYVPETGEPKRTGQRRARPRVIIGTVASLLIAFSEQPDILSRIATIQIDEASQFPLTSLLPIGARCPHARYALIGDVHQLEPYADLTIQRIKPITVGDVLARCSGRIPTFNITRVFRCAAVITQICSDLFYPANHPLVPQRPRNEIFPINIELHLGQDFPLHIIFTSGRHERSGTSLVNEEEEQLAAELIRMISVRGRPRCNAGVLSFYKAQAARTSVIPELREVFVGTIDASQGQEFDLTIITTSRSTPFTMSPEEDEFINDHKRINVALTRSKGVCIVLLHENAYRDSRIWSKLVSRVPPPHRHTIDSWRRRARLY